MAKAAPQAAAIIEYPEAISTGVAVKEPSWRRTASPVSTLEVLGPCTNLEGLLARTARARPALSRLSGCHRVRLGRVVLSTGRRRAGVRLRDRRRVSLPCVHRACVLGFENQVDRNRGGAASPIVTDAYSRSGQVGAAVAVAVVGRETAATPEQIAKRVCSIRNARPWNKVWCEQGRTRSSTAAGRCNVPVRRFWASGLTRTISKGVWNKRCKCVCSLSSTICQQIAARQREKGKKD